jgi:hypothetical protein
MSLKLSVDSLEAVPETLRAHYKTGADGRLTLDLEGYEPVDTLKAEIERERGARTRLEGELARLASQPPPPDFARRQQLLERRLLEAEAATAIAQAKGEARLLMPHVVDRLRLAGDGAAVAIDIVDDAGQPRRVQAGADGAARAMTLSDLIAELRADPVFARAFEGTGRSGGGASAARTAGDGVRVISIHDQRAINAHVADIAAGRVRIVV